MSGYGPSAQEQIMEEERERMMYGEDSWDMYWHCIWDTGIFFTLDDHFSIDKKYKPKMIKLFELLRNNRYITLHSTFFTHSLDYIFFGGLREMSLPPVWRKTIKELAFLIDVLLERVGHPKKNHWQVTSSAFLLEERKELTNLKLAQAIKKSPECPRLLSIMDKCFPLKKSQTEQPQPEQPQMSPKDKNQI